MLNRNRRNRNLLDRDQFLVGGRGALVNRHPHYIPYPPVNLKKHEEYFDLEIAVPGFEKEDISIEVLEGIMTIKGIHKETQVHDETEFLNKEYDLMSFERTFQLTEITDENRIEAKYENGMLNIRLYHKTDTVSEKTSNEIKVS